MLMFTVFVHPVNRSLIKHLVSLLFFYTSLANKSRLRHPSPYSVRDKIYSVEFLKITPSRRRY